jgi:hypothetical protein
LLAVGVAQQDVRDDSRNGRQMGRSVLLPLPLRLTAAAAGGRF